MGLFLQPLEFLDFYYAKKFLKENDGLIALTETRTKLYNGGIEVSPLKEDKWLPECDALKEEFATLKKELIEELEQLYLTEY